MNDDNQNITRIERRGLPEDVQTYHGPAEVRTRANNVQVVTFMAAEESDLLHAAGSWMVEHPMATLLGMNWIADYLFPHEDIDWPGPPRHRLDLTVDLSNER